MNMNIRSSLIKCQHGYTLIELLLYVAILGTLLTTVTYFYGTVASARVKNQTIQEVNDQGVAVMDYLTQTVRNATAITAPTTGTSGPSLTLTVPTAALSPTIFNTSGVAMGYSVDGGTADTDDGGFINATKFVAPSTGTVSSLYALVGPVSASPNNKAQMAIYSGTTSPTTLLASSAAVTLAANSWNAFAISSVNVTSGQTYWLAYNTNATISTDNNLRYHTGTTGQSMYVAQVYGAWPASWTGTAQNAEFSVYAPITTGTPSVLQVKEGTGAVVPLVNDKVQISGLTFKNLSRAATPGSVQISFVLSRINPNNSNEFEYQKTFTSTAEISW